MSYIWKRRKTVYHVIEARQTMKHVQAVESAIFPSRVEVLTLPYMVWRVWLTEILETFQRVFRFEKSRIKENGGNFQENYQTAEIYFYLYHVNPLNITVSNYCVN